MIDGVQLSEVGCRSLQRMRWLQSLSIRRSRIDDPQLRRLVASLNLMDGNFDGTRLTPRSLLGMFQRDVRVSVEEQRLTREDIARLSEVGPDVQLVRCQLTPGAVAELANYYRVFYLVDCETQSRFLPLLDKYADAEWTK